MSKENLFENVKNYHEGILTKSNLEACCCSVLLQEDEAFRYIVINYEDGDTKFIYEDEKGYEELESNFHKNRYTSYHEFFTTKETGVEKRGALELKYYVRFPKEMYVVMPLDKAREALKDCTKESDVISVYGKYEG